MHKTVLSKVLLDHIKKAVQASPHAIADRQ
jgi:hypothetical protein